jgi:hypothetical protein
VRIKPLLCIVKQCYGTGAAVAIAFSKDPSYARGWANMSEAARAGWEAAIREALKIGARNPELFR